MGIKEGDDPGIDWGKLLANAAGFRRLLKDMLMGPDWLDDDIEPSDSEAFLDDLDLLASDFPYDPTATAAREPVHWRYQTIYAN
jgi:hypothetical protein